jgi:hypothetical protein
MLRPDLCDIVEIMELVMLSASLAMLMASSLDKCYKKFSLSLASFSRLL